MYSIFKDSNYNYNTSQGDFYFIYAKDNDSIISNGKLLNTISKIKSEHTHKEADLLVMEVPDDQLFLNVSFHYTFNLFPYSKLGYEKINTYNFLKCNNTYSTINSEIDKFKNSMKTVYYTSDYENIMNEYTKHKNLDALHIFGDKYPSKLITDTNIFNLNLLFLSDKINFLKKQKTGSPNYYDNYVYRNYDNTYLFLNKLKQESKSLSKYSFYRDSITYGNSSCLLKNLLKLKKDKFYTISSHEFSIENEIIYHENDFIRLSDVDIDIKKYHNLFELGLDKNNIKLFNMLKKCQENSLNNLKTISIEKSNELINILQNKINFIQNIDSNNISNI